MIYKLFIARLLLTGTAIVAVSSPLLAGNQEATTLVDAKEVIEAFTNLSVQGIPPILLKKAQGVAIIPNVIKAGFVFGGRFGRGVVLVRGPDDSWGKPVFVTMAGGSFGWQLGVQSTDILLIFKNKNSLERILNGKGKLTLGADLAVAAGPLGRQAELGTDLELKSEIYSYSRSRGLFAGLSLEGAAILVDHSANDTYFRAEPPPFVDQRGVTMLPLSMNLSQVLTLATTKMEPIAPRLPIAPINAAPPIVQPPVPPLVQPSSRIQ